MASIKIMLRKEETKRCDMSTTTNDFNSHPTTRCTRIQVDYDSTRNLSSSVKYGQAQNWFYKSKRPSVIIYQEQWMTSIRTQAHSVLAFKLTPTRLGISLSLSNVWQEQKNVTKRRDQVLWYVNNNEWLQFAPDHTVYSHSSWLRLD